MKFEKKPKELPKVPHIPKEMSGIIRDFSGMSGPETTKGYLQTYREAQRLTLAARNEFMTGAVGGNVRWVKAYAKERNAYNQFKMVLVL